MSVRVRSKYHSRVDTDYHCMVEVAAFLALQYVSLVAMATPVSIS